MSFNACGQLYTLYQQDAQEQWDHALERVRYYLHYPYDDSELVRKLTTTLLTVSRSAHFHALGCDSIILGGFLVPYTVIALLKFTAHLVGYELLDDGSPGVAYYKFGDLDLFEQCGKDDDGAVPYIHANVEVLRQQYPEAEALTMERTLEILQFHEDREQHRRAHFYEMQRVGDTDKDDRIVDDDEVRDTRLLAILVQELEEIK